MWSNQRENKVFNDGMYTITIRCRATNKILGTTPGNVDVYREYIADNAPTIDRTEEEVQALANTLENFESEDRKIAPTVFPMGKFLKTPDNVFYDPIYDVVPDGVEGLEEVTVPFMWDYQMRGSFKEAIQMLSRASQDKVAKKAARQKAAEDPAPDDAAGEEAPKKRGRKKKTETEEAVSAAMGGGNKYASAKITAYKKTVDGGWFVKQRRIPFLVPETWVDELGMEHPTWRETPNGRCLHLFVRPLRADTPQGPRTALAASEFLPVGTEFYCTIQLLNPKDKEALLETLDFREKVGILQFRGGGKGTIIWTPADNNGKPVDEIP